MVSLDDACETFYRIGGLFGGLRDHVVATWAISTFLENRFTFEHSRVVRQPGGNHIEAALRVSDERTFLENVTHCGPIRALEHDDSSIVRVDMGHQFVTRCGTDSKGERPDFFLITIDVCAKQRRLLTQLFPGQLFRRNREYLLRMGEPVAHSI